MTDSNHHLIEIKVTVPLGATQTVTVHNKIRVHPDLDTEKDLGPVLTKAVNDLRQEAVRRAKFEEAAYIAPLD